MANTPPTPFWDWNELLVPNSWSRGALVLLPVNILYAVLERGILVILHLEAIRKRGKGYHWLFLFRLGSLCMHLIS
jgi:hypothetical protein